MFPMSILRSDILLCGLLKLTRVWRDRGRPSLSIILQKTVDLIKYYAYTAFTHASPQFWNIRTFRFGIPIIVKSAQIERDFSTEAHALRFLNNCGLELPVPRLIDSFSMNGKTYTVMSKLPGRMLYEVWRAGEIDAEQMNGVCTEVASFLRTLWELQQPPEITGKVMMSASGDGLPDPRFFHEACSGPYDSILQCYQNITSCQSMEVFEEEQATEADRQILAADHIVWVHPDLRMYNVLVDENYHLSGIIDWEDSGWLPMHWQLWALKLWPIRGCEAPWFTFWKNYKFPPEAERGFEASKRVTVYPLVP